MAYPDGCINHKTTLWFKNRGMPISNILAANHRCSVVANRNRVVRNIVLPRASQYEWFIFIDRDNVPDDKLTDPFLDDVKADVVGCTYEVGKGAWQTEDTFHMGLCRVRTEMFPKIKPPWFMFEYNEDGTEIISCECHYLRKKLLEQGAVITRRGWLDHEGSASTWQHSA